MRKFVAYDDLRYLAGELVPATRTEILTFAGKSVELDLTDESVGEIFAILQKLFDTGAPVQTDKQRRVMHTENGKRVSAVIYNRHLRAWAESVGRPVKRQADGTYAYPKALRQDYAAYLAKMITTQKGGDANTDQGTTE